MKIHFIDKIKLRTFKTDYKSYQKFCLKHLNMEFPTTLSDYLSDIFAIFFPAKSHFP